MIALRDVSFTYEGAARPSLERVSLTAAPGEVIVLAGESGCGKTTITRCLNGLIPHFYPGRLTGQVSVGGDDLTKVAAAEIGRRVASVFQDPRSQFFTTRTTTEVAFACENFGMDPIELRARVDGAFEELGIADLFDRSVFELSSGEKQKIAIAASYALRPAVVVMDEPSANLDLDATRELARVIGKLKDQGATVIIAEHRLFYLAEILDRLVYLRDGAVADTWTREQLSELSSDDLAERRLRQIDLAHVRMRQPRQRLRESTLLQMHDVRYSYQPNGPLVLDALTMHGRRGEVVGIAGDNGSGKTTAAKIAVGLLQPTLGRVRVDYDVTKKKQRLKRAFFVMQEADYQLYAESVLSELTLGQRNGHKDEAEVKAILADLGLDDCGERHPQTLSGGQKQRLTIAVGLASDPDYLFLDEPTSGLDAGNMARVADAVRLLADRDKFVCVISHDYELLATACERVLRVDAGRVVDEVAVRPGAEEALLDLVMTCSPA